jgi:hypothetical protein
VGGRDNGGRGRRPRGSDPGLAATSPLPSDEWQVDEYEREVCTIDRWVKTTREHNHPSGRTICDNRPRAAPDRHRSLARTLACKTLANDGALVGLADHP